MKRRITLSIALVLSIVLVSLTSSDRAVNAQNQQMRVVADTGMFSLGANQMLRVTVAPRDVSGNDNIRIRFKRMEYIEQGNVYKIGSQSTSSPITLAPDEAVGFDHIGNFNFRGVVLSNSPDVRVNVSIIDTVTGATVTSLTDAWPQKVEIGA